MTVVHVAKDPDICLVLPSGDSDELRIFASIGVLRNASPVFNSILNPNDANNHGASSNDLLLPEDNAQAMLFLVQAIHLRFRELAQAVAVADFSVERIHDTTALAEKYGIYQAMALTFHLLVTHDRILNMVAQDLWRILSVSYIIGRRDIFKLSSARLLANCAVPYYTLIGAGVPRQSDMRISVMLEEKRARLRSMVSTQLFQELEGLVSRINEGGDSSKIHRATSNNSLDRVRLALTDLNETYPFCERILAKLDGGFGPGLCFDYVEDGAKHEHNVETD